MSFLQRAVLSVCLVTICGSLSAQKLEPGASDRWEVLPGNPDVEGTGPVLLFEHAKRYFLVERDYVQEYLPEENRFVRPVIRLPHAIGQGAAATSDGKRFAFIAAGGKSPSLWRLDLQGMKIQPLPGVPTRRGVSVGGSLAYDEKRKHLYCLPGGLSRTFLRLEPDGTWKHLTRVGDKTGLAGIGATTGMLMWIGDAILAWPDHHVQHYDIKTGVWLNRVWISYGIRPHYDGAMWALDRETGEYYIVMGLRSRTLTYFEPRKRKFNILRPRLPLRIDGEGSRAVVAPIGGKKHLIVYATRQGNHICRIPLDQLEKVTADSPAADVGSPWMTHHEAGGSSLVRTPAQETPLPGLMGMAGNWWYFARLANLRYINPVTRRWTKYPGVKLWAPLMEGLCAASDEKAWTYVLTGSGKNFVRVALPGKNNELPRTAQKLTRPPMSARTSAQASWWSDRFYLLPGGETRKVLYYSPRKKRWTEDDPLPGEATPVGKEGSALIAMDIALVAITGTQVWRYSHLFGWSKVCEIPFTMKVKGGMAAGDFTTNRLYVVEGGESRRIVGVDLSAKKTFEVPILPDVVSVAGGRALVHATKDSSILALHRGHDSHEVLILPLKDSATAKGGSGR